VQVWQKYLPAGRAPKTKLSDVGLPQPPKRHKKVSICKIADPGHPAYGQHGLFATANLPPRSHILDYRGFCTLCGDESSTSDYTLRMGDLTVDAAQMGTEARYINDFRGTGAPRANAAFEERRDEAGRCVMGVWAGDRGVRKGEEVLLSYGKGFWTQRGLLGAAEAPRLRLPEATTATGELR